MPWTDTGPTFTGVPAMRKIVSFRNKLMLAIAFVAVAALAAPAAMARDYQPVRHGSHDSDMLGALIVGAVIGGVLVSASQHHDRYYYGDRYGYGYAPQPTYYGGGYAYAPQPAYGNYYGGYPGYSSGGYYGNRGYTPGYGYGQVNVRIGGGHGYYQRGRRDGHGWNNANRGWQNGYGRHDNHRDAGNRWGNGGNSGHYYGRYGH